MPTYRVDVVCGLSSHATSRAYLVLTYPLGKVPVLVGALLV